MVRNPDDPGDAGSGRAEPGVRSLEPELLAALLDGKLSDAERAEALELLSRSPVDAEVFADAAAILADLNVHPGLSVEDGSRPAARILAQEWDPAIGTSHETEGNGATESAHRPTIGESPRATGERGRTAELSTRSRRTARARWLALAAGIMAIAVTAELWSRLRPLPTTNDPGRIAALLDTRSAGLPKRWSEAYPWGSSRSAGSSLTPHARATRLGALLVDLEVAAFARDTETSSRLAAGTVALLEDIPASGPVAAVYRELGRRAGEPLDRITPLLERGRDGVAQLADERFVGFGAWTEAARIAAARRETGFFRTRASRAALDRLARTPALPADVRAAGGRVRAAAGTSGAPNWRALEEDLGALLRALAS